MEPKERVAREEELRLHTGASKVQVSVVYVFPPHKIDLGPLLGDDLSHQQVENFALKTGPQDIDEASEGHAGQEGKGKGKVS